MQYLQKIFQQVGYSLQASSASDRGEEFLFIPNPDGSPRWVWPSRLRQPLFLQFYNSSTLKSNAFSFLIRLIFLLRLQKRVFKKMKVELSSFQIPKKAFCPFTTDWALFTGTPGPNRKGIFICKGESSHAFLKVAMGSSSAEGMENEALALTFLSQGRFSNLNFPSVLLKGKGLVMVSEMKGGKRENILGPLHQKALMELARVNAESVSLKKIPAWNEALQKIENLSKSKDQRLPKGLVRKLSQLANNLDWNQRVDVCFSHGDFTPWNMKVGSEKIGVYDWELSDPQRPLGFDAFHFVVQQGILVEHKPWKEIRKTLEDQTRFIVSAEHFEQYLGFYLVINSAYYLDLYSRQENWHTQIHWLLETWSMAISDLLQCSVYQRGTVASDLVDFLQNHPYATLKFAPAFPEAIDENSDIDICLNKKSISKIETFLQAHPLVKRCKVQARSHMETLRLELLDGSWLVLDAIWQLKWKHLEMMEVAQVLNQATVVESGIKKASKRMEAIFTGLFYGLNGAEVPAKYRQFQSHLKPEVTKIENVLSNAPKPQKDALIQVLKTYRANKATGKVKNASLYLLDTLTSFFWNRGFTVTFSGVDGAGKSTVIEEVKQRIEKQMRMRVVVLRHRPSLLPILSAWTKGKARAEQEAAQSMPRQGKNSSLISSLFRFGYYYTDYLIGQYYVYFRYIMRGYVVLYDRYYFDFINDGKRSNIALPETLISRGYLLLQKPELNLFLYAEPATILSRKQELSAETISELTARYQHLFAQLGKKHSGSRYLSIQNEELENTLNLVMSNVKKLAA